MADTYSQMYVHVVFAVRNRSGSIHPEWEDELHKYITGIVTMKDQKLLAINGMPDHLHLLIGMRPTCCLSDLVREIKKSSTAFVQEKKFTPYPFRWQTGFGAFTFAHRDRYKVINYVRNQKEHHRQQSFKMEYHEFLKDAEIDFKEEFLFDWTGQ